MAATHSDPGAHRENPHWRTLLDEIKTFFPSPWKGTESESGLENQLRLALGLLEAMKHTPEECYLGDPRPPDFQKALEVTLNPGITRPQRVIEELVGFFNGMLMWSHPKSMENVVPPPTIASIVGNTLGAAINANMIEDETSWGVAASEIQATAMLAQMVGYDPQVAGGVFTFGGTGCYLYATKLALTKCLGRVSRYEGVRTDAQILVSKQGHYCKLNCSDWSGLGMNNVREINVDENNRMSVHHLKQVMRQCHREGKPIAMVVCTMGTTDAFAVDPIVEVKEAIDEFFLEFGPFRRPLLYADAAIGWAWTCFRGYDFSDNPLQFSPGATGILKYCSDQTKDLAVADAVGCDLHKTGWTPYISSLFMVKDGADFQLLDRGTTEDSYLYNFGSYHPGKFTLETSRPSCYSLAGWANMRLFGLEGFRVMLGHLMELEVNLRNLIRAEEALICVNPEDHGIVTIFRVYPPSMNAEDQYFKEFHYQENSEELLCHNEFQVEVANELHRMRLGGETAPAIGLTKSYRQPLYNPDNSRYGVVALKAYPMSPHSDEEAMRSLIRYVLEARDRVVESSGQRINDSHSRNPTVTNPSDLASIREADLPSPAENRWGRANYIPIEHWNDRPGNDRPGNDRPGNDRPAP